MMAVLWVALKVDVMVDLWVALKVDVKVERMAVALVDQMELTWADPLAEWTAD
jgi:hypothetical protein